MEKVPESVYCKIACGFLLAAVWMIAPSSFSTAWSMETILPERLAITSVQYSGRVDRLDETAGQTRNRDWYDDAYEEYEESPYGYYEEDAFYDDFDLNYWQRDAEGEWYEKRFNRYGRGYLGPER